MPEEQQYIVSVIYLDDDATIVNSEPLSKSQANDILEAYAHVHPYSKESTLGFTDERGMWFYFNRYAMEKVYLTMTPVAE